MSKQKSSREGILLCYVPKAYKCCKQGGKALFSQALNVSEQTNFAYIIHCKLQFSQHSLSNSILWPFISGLNRHQSLPFLYRKCCSLEGDLDPTFLCFRSLKTEVDFWKQSDPHFKYYVACSAILFVVLSTVQIILIPR